MRRLTDHEREALVEVGPPGTGGVPDSVFTELAELGWGRWVPDPDGSDGTKVWIVTPAGRRALELDTLARNEL
jgi:hypothetical protein